MRNKENLPNELNLVITPKAKFEEEAKDGKKSYYVEFDAEKESRSGKPYLKPITVRCRTNETYKKIEVGKRTILKLDFGYIKDSATFWISCVGIE